MNPASDIETITTELILADLQTIDKAVPGWRRGADRQGARPNWRPCWPPGRFWIQGGRCTAGVDVEPLQDLHLLTAKPFLYVFNCDAASGR